MQPDASSGLALITGGTGLLGSHIAEQLAQRGVRVKALVRPNSDTRFLQSLGVELVTGDLTDSESCRRATEGVDTVFHCAAKVGDWGKWAEFQTGCLDATENLARAPISTKIKRFVHISSTSAYGHPKSGTLAIDESAPLGQNFWWIWDDYTRSKVECERILWGLVEREGLRLTVIRPSWLYGERDRTTTARIIGKLRGRGIPLIGRGDNPLSAIYAGCVAEAAILAASHPAALNQAYNVTDQGPITQRDFFALWARTCGVNPGRWRWPYPSVYSAAFLLEAKGKLLRSPRPPLITRYATWLMGRYLSYSTEKARTQLGWRPSLTYEQAIERTVRWFEAASRS